MKKKNYLLATILASTVFVSCSSSKSDIVIADFESDNFNGWVVEGDAFGSGPTAGTLPGQQEVKGFQGKKLANSYSGGDDSRGTLISPEFTIDRDYINFLLGGGRSEDVYIELLVDGKIIYKTRPIVESETLQWMSWDVKKYNGQKAQIKIVDNQRGAWGHILVDQIEQSDKEKSIFMVDHKLSFDVNKKYLLVPIETDGPESIVELEVDGQKSPKMYIRVAQTKTDYWVPIDVEKYKGKTVNLIFEHLKKTDTGFSEIKQSDSFDFDYNEKYRPVYHFTPLYGWMNDPNGMVYNNGEYNLFYQHNPYGSKWGNMHWGHATSKDMVKWEHQPEAIAPDSLGTIFSGSAIIDKNNTAGFGKDALIAIYTSAGDTQTQSIAYSTDNGKSFTKYTNNPVLADPAIADFRDPKVFWHDDTNQWVMSLATSQTITFYGSKNMKEWTKLSEFGKGIGDHGGVWECPDLMALKTPDGRTKWVLFVSINPGGPNGGSATQYFIGDFDGKTFKADSMDYPLWLDYGRDNYAGVTWSNIPASDGRHLFIGWMNNWDYANNVPIVNFKSAMTVPRELSLVNNGKHLVLANNPAKEVLSLRKSEPNVIANFEVTGTHTIDKLLDNNTGAYELLMTVKVEGAGKFNFKLSNSKNEYTDFIFDLDKEQLSVDRTKSGLTDFSNNFASVNVAPLVKKNTYQIRLLVDKASTELFVNNGELVSTNIIYPTEPYNSLILESTGKVVVEDVNIYKLN